MDELVFLNHFLLGRTALRSLYLHLFSQAGNLGDLLDVAVDDLVLEVRELIIVLLENGLQLSVTKDGDLGSGLLLADG